MIPLVWVAGIIAAHHVLTKKKSRVGLDITGPSGSLSSELNRGRGYAENVGAVTKADRLAYFASHKPQLMNGFPTGGALPAKVRAAMGAAQNFFAAKIQQGQPSASAANQAVEKYKKDVHLTRKLLLGALIGGPLVLGVQIAVHKKIINAIKIMGTLDARITSSGFKAPKPKPAQPRPGQVKREDRRKDRRDRKGGSPTPAAASQDAAAEEEGVEDTSFEEEAPEEEAPAPQPRPGQARREERREDRRDRKEDRRERRADDSASAEEEAPPEEEESFAEEEPEAGDDKDVLTDEEIREVLKVAAEVNQVKGLAARLRNR